MEPANSRSPESISGSAPVSIIRNAVEPGRVTRRVVGGEGHPGDLQGRAVGELAHVGGLGEVRARPTTEANIIRVSPETPAHGSASSARSFGWIHAGMS